MFGKLCHLENDSHATPSSSVGPVSIDAIQGDGKVDPNSPDHLSGSTEEKDGERVNNNMGLAAQIGADKILFNSFAGYKYFFSMKSPIAE